MRLKILPSLFLAAGLFLCLGFRFSDVLPQFGVPEDFVLDAFPLVIPTVVYGLEEERFTKVELLALEEATSFKQLLKQLKVHWKVRKALLTAATNRLGDVPVALKELKLFYQEGEHLASIAAPISNHSFLRLDITNQKIKIGDLVGIESEYAATTLFFNGDLDSTLHYTLLDTSLQVQIRQALSEDMPLDTAFHAGVVKLIYTIKRNELGEVVGYGGVEALRFRVNQQEQTSIRFADGELEVDGFFLPDGRPALQTYLPSPVPGARLSSPYSMRRMHPVLKRIKPHFGTDYAAPYGTPVLAVSDGIVIARGRTRSNGNYVKISHNDTYQSQYLHLKGFASGIKSGTRVTKGQVIGYVGSTGLADGPHVCFRFWRNDHQIDHRKECLPTNSELTGEALMAFRKKQQAIEHLLAPRA